MQISGKMLLNSAESILRDRREEARGRETGSARGNETDTDGRIDALQQGILESRLLKLQASLGNIQNDYSREQARFTYLTAHPEQMSQSLQFNNEPLFPELKDGVDPDVLRTKVSDRLTGLVRALKSIQVEMENLYALNFNSMPSANTNAETLISARALKTLDPSRVARLTRD